MPKRDWEEVKTIIDAKSSGLLIDFISSGESFLPNSSMLNPFDENEQNFSAKQLEKKKPGSWIPLYSPKSLSNFFLKNKISPIRSGKAAFFLYKGEMFFNLCNVNYIKKPASKYKPIDSFIPLTLKSNFQRNENAYLNKAVSLGIINHFVDGDHYNIFRQEIINKSSNRLLYGQFGKIMLTEPMYFLTRKAKKAINPGFQFEIDLVLENEKEIIIFEAKMSATPQLSFYLLERDYPLIYFKKLTGEEKQIRTIFIDIIYSKHGEEYRLIEFFFKNDVFDDLMIKKQFSYPNNTKP